MTPTTVRRVDSDLVADVVRMRSLLFTDCPPDDQQREVEAYLGGTPAREPLGATLLVAEHPDRGACGFVEVSLRSHAEGCYAQSPIAYVEGWWVDPDARRQGVGAALLRAAEAWGREQGCVEIASDTGLDNAVSQAAHLAFGFEEVERVVCYRKRLEDS